MSATASIRDVPQIPLGDAISDAIDWLEGPLGDSTKFISVWVEKGVRGLTWGLNEPGAALLMAVALGVLVSIFVKKKRAGLKVGLWMAVPWGLLFAAVYGVYLFDRANFTKLFRLAFTMERMPLTPVYSAMCLVSVVTGAWAAWRVTKRARAGLASLAGLLAGWFLWYYSTDVIRGITGDADWSWFLPFYSYNLEYHWLFTILTAVAFIVGGIVWRVSHKWRHGLTALLIAALLFAGLYAALGFSTPLAIHDRVEIVQEVRPSLSSSEAVDITWNKLTPEERDAAVLSMSEKAYTPVWYRMDLQRFLVILGFAALAFGISRNLPIAIFTAVGFLFLWNLGLWVETLQTLAIVVLATCISILIGIPLGIAAALSRLCRMIIMPVLDFMQTLPAFVYLIPVIPFFGLGATPAIFATFIFSVPPAIRLTTLGIQQVPGELVEAADAFGSTTGQKLVKLQIPIAAPSIRAGINQTVLLALSMAVIAAMIGAPGLGSVVWTAIQRLQVGDGFEGGIGIVIVAMILDRILQQASAGKKAPPAQH